METTPMPIIGDQAADFKAITTKGKIKFLDFAKNKSKVIAKHINSDK